MPTGVELQLFDGATPAASVSNIQAQWWDVEQPKDMSRPVGKAIVSTDSNGYIYLDLSNVTGLAPTESGFLLLYKLDGTDHKDSPLFAGKVATSTITSGVDMYYYDSGWTRPSDWLALPEVLVTDQKFVGLHAVYPENSNFVALSAEGAYTVDWGDGTTENFASGVVAQRNIDYAATALNGTECSRGYKQAIITVTPQAGHNLTKLDLHRKHTQAGLQAYSSGFVDIALASALLTDLRLGFQTPGGTTVIRFSWLEQVNIVRSNLKQCVSLLSLARRLMSIVDLATSTDAASTSAVTFTASTNVVNHTGHGRINGESVIFSVINTTTGIAVDTRYFIINRTADTYQLSNTYAGAALPLTNNGTGTAAYGTNFSGMFSSCSSLQTIPLFDTSSGTALNSMFSSCTSLQTIPLLDTSNGVVFSSMFSGCSSLQSVPLLNIANGTALNSMFSSCTSLQTIPLLNTASGTNFNSMFSICSSLQSVPLLNTSSGTKFDFMFTDCFSLQTIPLLDTSNGNPFSNMFSGCHALRSLPLLNVANGTDFTGMFSNCNSLERGALSGTKFTISYTGCKLSGAELNRIYENLGTPASAQTITVSNNWGTASDNPALVPTNWTVSGS